MYFFSTLAASGGLAELGGGIRGLPAAIVGRDAREAAGAVGAVAREEDLVELACTTFWSLLPGGR